MQIRAKFSSGLIHPIEPLDLPEDAELLVDIVYVERTLEERLAAIRSSAGAWKGLIDAEELKRDIYADRLIKTRRDVKL